MRRGRPLDAAVATLDPGEPLDAGTLAFMEPRFNYNFSKVRVHADSRAAESARSVNALAYTVGRDVVFGAGQYAPTTLSGRQLLAHELTHVVQQQATGHRRLDRQPAPGTKPTETYQTDVPILPPGHFEARAKFIYWVERVSSVFNVLGLPDRLFKDEDERDAVLAALWRVRPGQIVLDANEVCPDPHCRTLDQAVPRASLSVRVRARNRLGRTKGYRRDPFRGGRSEKRFRGRT